MTISGFLRTCTRSAFTVAASCVTRADGGAPRVSNHLLEVEDDLVWRYVARDDEGREEAASCDGAALTLSGAGVVETFPVPGDFSALLEPVAQYAWWGVRDRWVVELVRPFDALGLLVLDDVREEQRDGDRRVVVTARPDGREPSGYVGLAGRVFDEVTLVLDPGRALIVSAECAVGAHGAAHPVTTIALTDFRAG